MGRWFYNKKDTVSGHHAIDIRKLREWGWLKGFTCGTLRWSRGGEETGSMDISIDIRTRQGNVWLNYAHNKTESLNYQVQLVTTACNYGGFRWWFLCPLIRNGYPCQRRVGVLYVAGKYAGCRYCYDLTYESCQDSHKFDFLAQSMGLPNEKALKRVLGW